MAVSKTIDVGGIDVPFRASAATPRIYRTKFGRDIYKDLSELQKNVDANNEEASTLEAFNLEMFEDLAWVMAYQADKSIPAEPEEWLDQFDTFSIYEILPQLIELWGLNTRTDIEAKENFRKAAGK